MRYDDARIQVELYCHGPEKSRRNDKRCRSERAAQNSARPGNARLVSLYEGNDCQSKYRKREKRGAVTVRDLDDQAEPAFSRRIRPIAIRPMIAASESGSGDPDDRAKYYL
jgi:hypothetical protein